MEFIKEYNKKVMLLVQKFDKFLKQNIDSIVIIEEDKHTTKLECLWNVFEVWNKWWYIYNIREWYNTIYTRCEIWDYSAFVWKWSQVRSIKIDKMQNDLFFSFTWATEKVKLTWYNDNDWWTKYKPETIKEWDVTWKIDYDNMRAIYIWK